MSYRFEIEESVGDGFARCAAEQLDHAVSQLRERLDDEPVDAVHAARKAVKKERSLLRLVRGSMPAKQRRHANRALRDAARGLSTARDAEVMVNTVDQLSTRYVGQLPESAFGAVREQLVRTRNEQRAQLSGSGVGAQAARELDAVRSLVGEWTLDERGWDALESGLRRAYKDGRNAFARARSSRELEDWHAWRKRVKDLSYHERLLSDIGGPAVKGQAKDAHVLADLLGDDHDLGVLHQWLTHGEVEAAVDVDALSGLVKHRRAELEDEALWLGSRVYAESPKAFTERIRRSWQAGRGRTRAAG
jgi:CHAD domain-containing protein